jgi:hypothetical protein
MCGRPARVVNAQGAAIWAFGAPTCRGRITPKAMHDGVELDLPLALSQKAS